MIKWVCLQSGISSTGTSRSYTGCVIHFLTGCQRSAPIFFVSRLNVVLCVMFLVSQLDSKLRKYRIKFVIVCWEGCQISYTFYWRGFVQNCVEKFAVRRTVWLLGRWVRGLVIRIQWRLLWTALCLLYKVDGILMKLNGY